MRYDKLERADADHTAETFGLKPGVAGVYMEHKADVFCQDCATDILGEELMERLSNANLGYDHPMADELGNVAVTLTSEEWDCPGATCGHCGIPLDVRVIHYGDVCQPDTCEEMAATIQDPDGQDRTCEAAVLEQDDGDVRVMLKEDFKPYGERGDTSWIPESDVLSW